MNMLKVIVTLCAMSGLVACGPSKPKPKTGNDVGNGTGSGAGGLVPKAKPKRKVSADAKAEFKKAVAAYKSAQVGGGIKGCEDVASNFADVYDSYPKLIEAKFNEGAVYHECGQVAKAKAVYNEILAKHPNYGPALNNLGYIAAKKGQPGQAREFFTKAAATKTSEAYANLAKFGRERALRGDVSALAEGVNNIHRALAVDSDNIEAYDMLATMIYDHAKNKSQLEIARLIIVQALKRYPKYARLYNLLGLTLLKMNEVTRALKQFRKAVSLDGGFVEAHMNIGAITLSFRDYKTAETSFKNVLGQEVDKQTRLDATIGLGVAYRGQRRFKEAMAQYKAAKRIAPDDPRIDYNMGLLKQDYMFDAGNPGQAIAQLEEARRLYERYLAGGKSRKKKKDARRRIKNIKEMVPMLREQQKMMKSMQQGGK